ncbi:MAG: hypothetical protein J6K44_08140 [Clostridia bacterium]|nr:hypothetical protein [Clostridia bacterium]
MLSFNLASAQFYKAASPENYLDVSDMSVSILETNLRKLSTITVSLNSLPTEEELVAYYKAFITEYQDAGEYIYTYKSYGDNKLTTESQINSQANSLYSNSNAKIYMYLTTSYSCELRFSLDTDNSQLIITLEMVYT